MKIKYPTANPKSKTQVAKRKYEEAHPTQYVGCHKCGAQVATLTKIAPDKYICNYCAASNN